MEYAISKDSEAEMKYNIILILSAMFSGGMMIAAPWFLPKAIYLSIYLIIGIPSAVIMAAVLICARSSSKG